MCDHFEVPVSKEIDAVTFSPQKSPSGQMSRSEFEVFYDKLFSADSERKFLDHLFRTFDFNNDGESNNVPVVTSLTSRLSQQYRFTGQINFKEFVCGISIATRGTPDEKLTWTFNVYDVNHDGTISREEVGEIMRVSSLEV